VATTTRAKRAWLRREASLALAGGRSLAGQLSATLNTAAAAVASGQAVAATSAFGHSVTFSRPGEGAPTPADIAELCDEALELHDACRAALVSTGTPAPTDAQILSEMLHRWQPCRESTSSFIGLRLS
jgi:hypothetical protein